MYKNFIKRWIDFTIAFLGLLILSPIFVIVTICLYFANDGKPFFFQARPGLNEKIFKIIKFKTMNDKKDASGNLLSDAERLTPVGAFIRKTSLDELPQLINVLKGDMSLIGPRPLLEKYLPYYTEREKLRHSLRPGITGWAQLKGRNTLKWDDRLSYDIQYVQNVSLKFDLKIIFSTFKKVFKSEDIVVDPRSIMKDLDEERMHN
ncbi:sugar transferase [Chryseobacterium sp. SSA4.19]|uniref:sugar transferase n=1 Tax=Chryseobacterium sp. SSA4.19 TaxID=2919915 RepID=UPI001F4D49A3|nr:sugar transferase [Chryseobacterium sp. SSA4.19]MCJ8152371.1 sugar transferase [Chryseobacterium sp. SSA4.19]